MTGSRARHASGVSAALSVDVEDWFQTENMKSVIPRSSWEQRELRVERNTMRILEILELNYRRATFFVLGWVAEQCPSLVQTIAAAGHEVASHGYGHDLVYTLTPGQFRADVLRSKHHLEDLIGAPVAGYRAPCFSITDWAIDILRDLGFIYDSSVFPTHGHERYGRLAGVDLQTPVAEIREDFYEICVSCLPFGRYGIPWGGGGYFRLIPSSLWQRGVRHILRSGRPYVFYIHPWEIDPGQPRTPGVKRSYAFRQRVNLKRCETRFEALVKTAEWGTVQDLLHHYKTAGHIPRVETSTSLAEIA